MFDRDIWKIWKKIRLIERGTFFLFEAKNLNVDYNLMHPTAKVTSQGK